MKYRRPKVIFGLGIAFICTAYAAYYYRYVIFHGANLRVDVTIKPSVFPDSTKVPGTNRVIITDAGISCAFFIGDTFSGEPEKFEKSPSRVWEQWCKVKKGDNPLRHYSALNLPVESDENGKFTLWLKLSPAPSEAAYDGHPGRYASSGYVMRGFIKPKNHQRTNNDYLRDIEVISSDHWIAK